RADRPQGLLPAEGVQDEGGVQRAFPAEGEALRLVTVDEIVAMVIKADHPQARSRQRQGPPGHGPSWAARAARGDNQRCGLGDRLRWLSQVDAHRAWLARLAEVAAGAVMKNADLHLLGFRHRHMVGPLPSGS